MQAKIPALGNPSAGILACNLNLETTARVRTRVRRPLLLPDDRPRPTGSALTRSLAGHQMPGLPKSEHAESHDAFNCDARQKALNAVGIGHARKCLHLGLKRRPAGPR